MLPDPAPPPPKKDAAYELTRERLNDWRRADLDSQNWRRDSAIDEEYYDGNQYDAETAELYKTYGLPLLVVNCIYNPINGVIGMQEKSLTDWILRDDHNNEYEELAQALTYKLKLAERETQADRACLDGFASQVKGGIGWVEVGDNTDPFLYPYRVDEVPWKEMAWDMRARKASLADAEYIRRLKFYRRDSVLQAFPNQNFPIMHAGTPEDVMLWAEPERLLRDHAGIRDLSRYDMDRSDRRNDSVAVEEVWYKVRVNGHVFRMPDRSVRRFDENNPAHLQAYYRGLIQPKPAAFTKMRQSFWIGPHKLLDRWSPLPHDQFPYVPFIAHQEASTGVPYGLIRVMRPLQDEVNTRRAKMMANLNSVRVLADDDAVDDHDSARQDVAKRNAYIVLNSKRRNANGFLIDKNQDLNAQQWEVYQDAVQKIQQTSGVHQSLLGKADEGVRSGVAIQSLVDQSITSLGRINANYRAARMKVGELLLAHVMRDMSAEGQQDITWERGGGEQRTVSVNVPRTDEQTGAQWVENDTSRIRMKVILDETPSTPTFRAQQFQEIVRTLDAMPEEVQRLMVPIMVEASELPNRKQIAELIRKQLGMAQPKTEEEAAEMEKEKAMADAAKQAELKQMMGKGEHEIAKAAKTRAETAAIEQDMEMQAAAGIPEEKTALYRW